MRLAITPQERLDRMRENIVRFGHLPAIALGEPIDRRLSIYGYGPSLVDTWQAPRGAVMTCSGAHRFLLNLGVAVDYHVEIDPRQYKVDFVRESHPDVTYLICSTCHPDMFDVLLAAGRKVHMWHGYTDDDLPRQVALLRELCPPDAGLIAGGGNAGTRAIYVGLQLGYRRFELHGFDCSYRWSQWAGAHVGLPQEEITATIDGKRFFKTSEVALKAVEDFATAYSFIEDANSTSARKYTRLVKIHGDGLLATWWDEETRRRREERRAA